MNLEGLASLLGNSADPLFVVDLRGVVLFANAAAVGVGIVQGQDLRTTLPPGDARTLLGCTSASVQQVSITNEKMTRAFTALSLDVSGADPGAQRLLICLKSGAPDLLGLNRREEFLSTAAHDLKNPIGAIFGFADALLDTESGQGMSETQRRTLLRIRGTAARCIDLVKNYQMLAALQAGAVRRPSEPVDLNAVAKTLAESLWREDPGLPRLEVKLCIDPLPVNADRVMLERMVSNLLSNAMNYTPPTGLVTLHTAVCGHVVVLSVSNTGTYISTEEAKRIFERYRRGPAAEGSPGTGLGLYIVQQLARIYSGTIAVHSDQRQQITTFELTLPRGQKLG